ncbi:hypothetical protein A2454_02250 [Candidatus Peribacteria bacterium RIFOXYC2_FULL_55_14]|nr:MAG: hypothetical protein UY90_C0080G0003 [Candidatus Peregrinibacteria bacterium GW2011_GWA2_54_9]OGJ71260.1 MAG: hypothetical protein A2198_05650 [Candidatus Peribacteria bacterium RIFOXYA1_FULL_56_14]OGJ74397.1 MAG: hypothetical protein A2384_06760 [Candidatus Peribacteria bacterium RIFOXYB1_FULL_54_35]OGJ75068.1 MAG: hypothetical protein A2217_05045 [Candidatus Peribacteria bacterium RIFOXYA2_FULL_55_28]OGJ76016.1 MAG: hypothetical protein A2327_03905 [Candidatus Peribacteria bacterium R
MSNIRSHEDLIVWQKAMELVKGIYELTSHFPDVEQYCLTQQIRRSAISIPSNIAEGKRRESKKVLRNFLFMAFGSGAELETQLAIARAMPFSKNLDFQPALSLLDEVMRMLNVMIRKLAT